jgi:hypothetical protein
MFGLFPTQGKLQKRVYKKIEAITIHVKIQKKFPD